MTPEQKYGYHRKYGRMPDERQPKRKITHAVVEQLGKPLTHPLPWALAQHKMKEFKQQGLKGLKLKGVDL